MPVKVITQYQADDGRKFNFHDDAERHNETLNWKTVCFSVECGYDGSLRISIKIPQSEDGYYAMNMIKDLVSFKCDNKRLDEGFLAVEELPMR